MSTEELILELVAIKKHCRDILIYAELTELINKLERGIPNEVIRNSSSD